MLEDRFKAAEIGDKWYFTGKPCKRNHISRRLVSSGACEECLHPGCTSARSRSAARATMSKGRFIVAHVNRELFESAALALAQSVAPQLIVSDLLTRREPEQISLSATLREYRYFPEHEEFLRGLERGLR